MQQDTDNNLFCLARVYSFKKDTKEEVSEKVLLAVPLRTCGFSLHRYFGTGNWFYSFHPF
ncbi:hypothetical protein ACJX0J_033242, partial [Zea mays]